MATTSTAAAKALAIPEILEMVLLQLPPQDLLRCQRVATLWRDSVVRSDEFQRRLFKKPRTNYEKWTSLVVCDSIPAREGIFVVQNHHPTNLDTMGVHLGDISVVEPNPLLGFIPIQRDGPTLCKCAAEDIIHDMNCGGEQGAFLRRPLPLDNNEPSLLDMYLTQPPITNIGVEFEIQTSPGDWDHGFWLLNKYGITVKHFLHQLKIRLPYMQTMPKLRITFAKSYIRMPDAWPGVFDAGIEKFAKLESKVGLGDALRIAGKDNKHSGKDIRLLLEGDNLDKIVAMGKVNAICMGASIPETLAEYDRMQSANLGESAGETVPWEEA
ncbi:hypothetical protein PRZ48_003849 [Zasmidium cellare]|uniref:F-box domain-containing protein n=1 Tax=Zasmidium cellare TaxID=395010 RepID=A0ABR0EW81_ZASCE|nr:hypothetical protein PRZ48_003849 [Zasmidium cellare]